MVWIGRNARHAACAATVLAVACATPAWAAETSADGAAPADIIVTAQKREQRLEEVPITVTVAQHQLLEDAGVHDIKALTRLVPGLLATTTDSEVDTTLRIRGIGTVGFNPALEPDVGVFVDGVYRPRNGVGLGDLGDIDRIEVLKGPQGTLFGKATTAGAVNVVTAAPTFTPRLDAELTAGNYGAVGGSGEVSGPLAGDTVAASLYVAGRSRGGFYDVRTGSGPRTARDDATENYRTVRAQLLIRPDAATRIRLIGDYTRRRESCCLGVVYAEGAALDAAGDTAQSVVAALAGAGNGEPQTAKPYDRVAYANQADPQHIDDAGVSAQIDHDLPALGGTLTSITAYRRWKTVQGSDLDYTDADLVVAPGGGGNGEQYRTFSQEVRIGGTAHRIDYTIGGFYAHQDIRYASSIRYGSQYDAYLNGVVGAIGFGAPVPGLLQSLFGPSATNPAGDGSADRYREHDDSYALFTNETWHVGDRLDLTGGLRYTIDVKHLASAYRNIGDAQACQAVIGSPLTAAGLIPASLIQTICLPQSNPAFDDLDDRQSEAEHALSGTVKAAYRFSPQVMGYASFARGFKAGGFNMDRVGCPTEAGCAPTTLTAELDTAFRPEFINSYEAGVKTTLLDRTLRLNLTGFYETVRNLQLNTFTGVVFVIDTVPAVHSKGAEADFVWQPAAALAMQGGVTIADTRFTKGDQPTLLTTGFLGKPGARLQLAPLCSATASATYTIDLPDDLALRLYAGGKFNSAYGTDTDEDPRKRQKAYAVADARVVLGRRDGRYDVELWVENAFDTHYIQETFDSPVQNLPENATGVIDAFLGAPRTFGATLRTRL